MNASHPPTCTCREHPWPASMRLGDALAAYLAENGFTTESYTSPKTEGTLFGMKIAVPNPPAHQRAIRLHDLQHIATGFGTDPVGEGELSSWQARRGLRGAGAYVAAIVLGNILVGSLYSPRRVLRWLREPSPSGSLLSAGLEYEALLASSVGELRSLLGLPAGGLAEGRRGLHASAPVTQHETMP